VITIVIPTWNGLHLLEPCFESLKSQSYRDFEIIVVDNGSRDGTVEWIRSQNPEIKLICLDENLGFAGAVNLGIKAATGDLIVLMNNDTRASENWLLALHKASQDYPDYAIFASKVLIDEPPFLIDTAGDGYTIAGFGYKIGWMRGEGSGTDHTKRIFGASGCSVLYRREVFEMIGDFDEDFFAFAEDLDLSFRALLAGYMCLYVPESKIYHAVRATAPKQQTLYLYHRNLIWLNYKNVPAVLMALYGTHMLLHMILVGARSIIQGWFPVYCKSIRDGLTGLKKMHKKRILVQNMRRVSVKEIRTMLTGNWIKIHWELSSLARRIRS